MLPIEQLTVYLNTLLQSARFTDYCPNGLQIAGRREVRHIVTGVTASQALIDAAIDCGADTLLVHHGYFWKGENPCLTGIKQRRIKALLAHDINLLAYHLPLDAHPLYGNNAQLAKQLGLRAAKPLTDEPNQLIWRGEFAQPLRAAEVQQRFSAALQRDVLHIGDQNALLTGMAWCTGAAQGYFQQVLDAGELAFLTGEISEHNVHLAREMQAHFFAAGHHATERYGVKALGEHLQEQFALKVEFIDIDNPV